MVCFCFAAGLTALNQSPSINSKNQNNFDLLIDEEMDWLAHPPQLHCSFHYHSILNTQRAPMPVNNQNNPIFPLGREDWNCFWFVEWAGAAVSIAIPFIIPFKNSKFFHSMNMQQLY